MAARRVTFTDDVAERIVRSGIAGLAEAYSVTPERAMAAKEMLIHVFNGQREEADDVDGYAAALMFGALARAIEAEVGSGLDWLAEAALSEWDMLDPELRA